MVAGSYPLFLRVLSTSPLYTGASQSSTLAIHLPFLFPSGVIAYTLWPRPNYWHLRSLQACSPVSTKPQPVGWRLRFIWNPTSKYAAPPLKANLLSSNTNVFLFLNLPYRNTEAWTQQQAYLVPLVLDSCVILGQSILLSFGLSVKTGWQYLYYLRKVVSRYPMLKTCHFGPPFFTTFNLLANLTADEKRLFSPFTQTLKLPLNYGQDLKTFLLMNHTKLYTVRECKWIRVCVLLRR